MPVKEILAKYGLFTLLCLGGITQVVLAKFYELTPWKGGGFGMFSTVDSGGHRRCQIILENGSTQILMRPPSYGSLLKQARNFPMLGRLEMYAQKIADTIWVPGKRSREMHRFRAMQDGEPSIERKSVVGGSGLGLDIWSEGDPIPDMVCIFDKITVSIFRPIFDGQSAILKHGIIHSVSMAGRSLASIAHEMRVDEGAIRRWR